MTSQNKYLPALDGLRGLAAMWVFLLHLWEGEGSPGWTPGHLGVDLFFVLSGFVLSHAYRDGLCNFHDYHRFLRARVARIYPLHLAVLFTTAAVVVLWPGFANSYPSVEARFGFEAFLAHLLLIQNWTYFLPTSWNTPAWSLSAEWAAYLVFPAFLLGRVDGFLEVAGLGIPARPFA